MPPRAVDWTAIAAHTRAVRAANRTAPEPRADPSIPAVTAERVRSFRARATHLDERLPSGSLVRAARGGLQDSAPRAALLALHARVAGVGPDSWEDPGLVQVWLRWADYLVPAADFDVFTRGCLPREAARAHAIEDFGDAVATALRGRERSWREVAGAFADIPDPLWIRTAQPSGRFRIRWDARSVTLIPTVAPSIDPEGARLELARRFLAWLGPATARAFARWAGIARADAETTWDALGPELAPVGIAGNARSVRAADLPALLAAEPVGGVRFLPQGDPLLSPDRLVTPAARTIVRPGVDRRLSNSVAAGRLMVDGAFVGSWGRRADRLTIAPWRALGRGARAAIDAEAEAMAGPIGAPIRIAWLE